MSWNRKVMDMFLDYELLKLAIIFQFKRFHLDYVVIPYTRCLGSHIWIADGETRNGKVEEGHAQDEDVKDFIIKTIREFSDVEILLKDRKVKEEDAEVLYIYDRHLPSCVLKEEFHPLNKNAVELVLPIQFPVIISWMKE